MPKFSKISKLSKISTNLYYRKFRQKEEKY